MALKFVVTDISTVPETFRNEYEARDGKYYLKIDGEIPAVSELQVKLAEFRDNNIGLTRKVQELETNAARFKDVDPAKYNEYKTKIEEFEKTGGIKSAEDVRAKIAEAVTPLQQELANMRKEKQEADDRIKRQAIESNLRDVATKAGVHDSAVRDFITRGLGVFNLEGKAMSGDTPLFSKKDVTKGLSMEEWAASLAAEAPHLFKPSHGGGAPPQKGAPGSSGGTLPGGQRFITGEDPLEFGRNLEGIAKGDVKVVPNQGG
jgi:hypothetical protein